MSVSVFLVVLAGVLVGAVLGLTGAGGSLLAVPVLVYLAGVPINEAVVMSLVGVAIASVSGLLPRARAGVVDWRTVAIMGAIGGPGSLVGSHLSGFASEETLNISFAVAMLVAVIATLHPPTGLRHRFRTRRRSFTYIVLAVAGFGVGILTGFLGVGGGFLIVPVLVALTELPIAGVVGVSLGVIALNSVTALLGHVDGTAADPKLVLTYGAAMLLASLAAAQLATHAADRLVRWVFCAAASAASGVMALSAMKG